VPKSAESGSKLHLAVDPTSHDIVAAEVSLENVYDAEVLLTLLNPLRAPWVRCIQMALVTAKPAMHGYGVKGLQLAFPHARMRDSGRRDIRVTMRC
jgi:hypothetical protein